MGGDAAGSRHGRANPIKTIRFSAHPSYALVQEEIMPKIIHNSEIAHKLRRSRPGWLPALAAAGLLAAMGCGGKEEVSKTTLPAPAASSQAALPPGANPHAGMPGMPAMPPGSDPHAGVPGMPAMPGGAMPQGMPAGQVPAPPKPSPQGALKWTTPKGWTEQQGTGMRFATLVPPGPGKAEMSVIMLPGPAGGELANVNRWRGQIGLPPIDEAALAAARKVVKCKAGNVSVYDFTSEGGVKSRMVVGLLTAPDGNTWFLKLMGEAEAVGKAKPAFMKYLETLHLG
jgi:hypothetical protein